MSWLSNTVFLQMFARQQTLAGQVQDVQPGGAAQEHMCDWLMSNKILDEISHAMSTLKC